MGTAATLLATASACSMLIDVDRLPPGGPACMQDADCDDGVFCNGIERCAGGSCAAGTNPCDDGVVCTADSCFANSCHHQAMDGACPPGDYCDTSLGCRPPCGTTDACNDGVDCTMDLCDTGTRRCSHTEIPGACDDGNVCSIDVCDPRLGCQHAMDPCDDGVLCTMDACQPGTGCYHTPDDSLCNDGDPCTYDYCSVDVTRPPGCVNLPMPCPADGGDAISGDVISTEGPFDAPSDAVMDGGRIEGGDAPAFDGVGDVTTDPGGCTPPDAGCGCTTCYDDLCGVYVCPGDSFTRSCGGGTYAVCSCSMTCGGATSCGACI